MKSLKDKINEKINETDSIPLIKGFHSTFTTDKVFNPDNIFEKFDDKKYGAFHLSINNENESAAKKIAESRVALKIEEAVRYGGGILNNLKDNPVMLEVEVYTKKSLELFENRLGQWNPFDVIREIFYELESGRIIEGFDSNDIEDYNSDSINLNGVFLVDLDYDSYGGEDYDLEYKEFLFVRDWLESKGYDSIKYKNIFEVDSDLATKDKNTFKNKADCLMVFRPENVTITKASCLKYILDSNNLESNNQFKTKESSFKFKP